NTILGREEFTIGAQTEECVRREAEVFGRRVTVARYFPLDSLECAKQRLAYNVSMCPPGPYVFLLVMPLDRFRGKEWMVEEQLEFPIESIWRYTIVLFTGGDALREIEQLLEREVSWKQLVEKSNNRYHVFDNVSRDEDGTQVRWLLERTEEVVSGNDGSCFEINENASEKF
ncbi:unnamed protein product, partial [Coregonus sp. 'balchen']